MRAMTEIAAGPRVAVSRSSLEHALKHRPHDDHPEHERDEAIARTVGDSR